MIRVFENYEDLSRGAAELFASKAAVAGQKRFSVALAGGSTPSRTYELLAQPPLRDRVPWADLHVFWGDERCVPPDDPRSNALMAGKALLSHVPVTPTQVHPLFCFDSPEQGAADYEKTLRAFFSQRPRFDLILLGLGDNGHTASLFPHAEILHENDRWVAEAYVQGEVPRVTFTLPVVNRARTVVFLVSGSSKAGVLREVLVGRHRPEELPAQLVNPRFGELIFLVDKDAAAEIGSL